MGGITPEVRGMILLDIHKYFVGFHLCNIVGAHFVNDDEYCGNFVALQLERLVLFGISVWYTCVVAVSGHAPR